MYFLKESNYTSNRNYNVWNENCPEWAVIIDRLDIAGEKGSELEGTATEPIQNETYNEKKVSKKLKASVTCGTISSVQIIGVSKRE